MVEVATTAPAFPADLTPELADILGRPCFTFIKWAQLYRAAGVEIPKSAEGEQAFFIHRMLVHWHALGAAWAKGMNAELQGYVDTVSAAQAAEDARAEVVRDEAEG